MQRLIKSRTLQTKLKIGQPGDVYEQEADRVADAVMRMPEPRVQRQVEPEEEETLQSKPLTNQITPLVQVQRQEEPEEEEILNAKPLAEEITPLVQRQIEPEEEEEEEIQTKQLPSQTQEIIPDVETKINSIRGGGQPLPESAGAFFEPRFKHDFSRVRVHTDAKAADTAQAVNARAFTRGHDVVFGAGQYAPGTHEERRLMAHELTHVVQQRGGRGSFQEKKTIGQPWDVYEQEADKITLVEEDTVNVKNKGLSPSPSLEEGVQRVTASEVLSSAFAVFDAVGSLLSFGNEGLKWKRNIAKAVHKWPAGRKPTQNRWVRDHIKPLLWIFCTSGVSEAWAAWNLRWNYNRADIDQAHVFKHFSSSWSGGRFGSEVNVTFEMQDASASYESGGKAAMICYMSGSLDPAGYGDIDFEARVLIYADGTIKNIGDFKITRGDSRKFKIHSFGRGDGWIVNKK